MKRSKNIKLHKSKKIKSHKSKRTQKRTRKRGPRNIWKMWGCATKHKKNTKKSTRREKNRNNKSRRTRGGSADAPLAYAGATDTIPTISNPYMAYTGPMESPVTIQNGGSSHALVGAPWGSKIDEWPGVASAHSGNHFKPNSYDIQPEMHPISESNFNPTMNGGKKRRLKRNSRSTKKNKMRGGQILSQLGTNLQNTYRAWNGEPALPSPLPYEDQMFYGRNNQDNLAYLKVN